MSKKAETNHTPTGNGTNRRRLPRFLCDHRITITRLSAIILVTILLFKHHPWQCSLPVQIGIKVLGFLMVNICVAGRIWSATYIGGRKTKTIVEEGPYSIVRHPLYMFSFIGGIGIGLSSMNTYLLVAIGLFLLLYYPGVLYHEERKMLNIHGDQYRLFRSRVPALIPKLSLLNNPDEMSIKPAKFQRDLIHAMYFLWIYMLFEIINYWHVLR